MNLDNKIDKEVKNLLSKNKIYNYNPDKVNVKYKSVLGKYKVYYDEKYLGSFKIN